MPRYALHVSLVDPSMQRLQGNFSLDPSAPVAVRGPQKVVDRFIKTFLTPKGSNPLHSKDGTDFHLLLTSNTDDPSDLEPEILQDVQDAAQQIRDIDARSPWLDADERLADAHLTAFNAIGSDQFEIYISISTVSGDRVGALLPFALNDYG